MQFKKSAPIILGFLSAASAMASPYYVDSMDCTGKIQGNHSQVHESYTYIAVKFTSFKSKRNDGTYAPSLRVATDYAKLKKDLPNDLGAEVQYTSSLQLNGSKVTHADGEYTLTVTNVRGKAQILTGTHKRRYSVAGNGYWYNLSCTANVINYPTRISDQTSKKN